MRGVWLATGLVVLSLAGCGVGDDGTQDTTSEPTVATTASSAPTAETSDAGSPTTTAISSTTLAPTAERLFAVDDLAFDASGVLWVTTGEGRGSEGGVAAGTTRELYRLVDDVWQLVEQPTTVFDAPINWEIRAANEGGVYLASGSDGRPSPTSGIYYTDGTTWQLFEQEFLCGSLAVDVDGGLWATCPDFLTRLVDGAWVDVPQGWFAQSVAAGADGSVWFTTFSGPPFELLRFDGTQWSTVGSCDNCYGPRSILGVDSDGAAWVARGECGLQGITRFESSGETEELAIKGARDIAFAEDGSAWIALPCEDLSLPAGVAHYSNGELRLFTTEDGLPDNDVQAVEVGPDGFIYAGTEFGVSRLDPATDRWLAVGGM